MTTDYGLTTEVQEHPEALLFKGTHQGRLRATVCGDCGHADLFVDNPGELWEAYLTAARGRSG